jgi:hypothetical protein
VCSNYSFGLYFQHIRSSLLLPYFHCNCRPDISICIQEWQSCAVCGVCTGTGRFMVLGKDFHIPICWRPWFLNLFSKVSSSSLSMQALSLYLVL